MNLNDEERELIESHMSALCEGYTMFDEAKWKLAVGRAKKKFPSETNLAPLMRRVLTDPRCDGYGVPFAHWWIAFEMRILPGIQLDPWSEVKWWLYLELRGKGQTLNMHGAQNAAKTAWMSRFSVVQMCVWLKDAEVYVSGPFKLHSDDKVWAGESGIYTWIKHLRQFPNQFTSELSLKFLEQNEICTVTDAHTGEQGVAKFVSLENASAVQGKKSAMHDESGMRGIILLIIDEFIENPGLKLKQAEGNNASNFNFFCLLGCNPDPTKVQHPAILKFSAPADKNIASLHRNVDFRWRTAYGICVRFAWANCPNNILGRTVWPYLLSQTRIDRAKEKGSEIIDAQIEAWAWGTGQRNSPLDEASIRMAGTMAMHPSDFTWEGAVQRVIHIDCAFGGQDPATYTVLEAGLATILNYSGGNNYTASRKVFHAVEQGVIQVDADFHATDEWIEEMQLRFLHTGGGFPHTTGTLPVKAGDRMGGNWHLAGEVLKLLIHFEIPATHCSFDASQRGDCVAPMMDCLGRHNVRWFYEGSRKIVDEEELLGGNFFRWPYEYDEVDEQGIQHPAKWSGYCTQTISMIWFFACALIKHGFLVGGTNVERGLAELCARPVVRGRQGQTEGRRDVLGKVELKKMGQASPTWGEGLATALYFGQRILSLVPIDGPKLSTVVHGQAITPMSIIRARGMNRRFGAPSDSRVEIEQVMATVKPAAFRPMTQKENAMNMLANPDLRR